MMNILLLSNNTELVSVIKTGLEENGCNVVVAYDTFLGEKILAAKEHDFIILDFDLIGSNNFDFYKRIRSLDAKTHVFILAEENWIHYNIEGFGFSADDFILKPVNLYELIYRINVFNRKNSAMPSGSFLRYANLEVDTSSKTIRRNNQEIKLTAREYKLLELLMLNRERVLDRMEIAEKLWGFNIKAGFNVINVHVNTLRNKIDKNFSPKLIHTLVGFGYVMRVEE